MKYAMHASVIFNMIANMLYFVSSEGNVALYWANQLHKQLLESRTLKYMLKPEKVQGSIGNVSLSTQLLLVPSELVHVNWAQNVWATTLAGEMDATLIRAVIGWANTVHVRTDKCRKTTLGPESVPLFPAPILAIPEEVTEDYTPSAWSRNFII